MSPSDEFSRTSVPGKCPSYHCLLSNDLVSRTVIKNRTIASTATEPLTSFVGAQLSSSSSKLQSPRWNLDINLTMSSRKPGSWDIRIWNVRRFFAKLDLAFLIHTTTSLAIVRQYRQSGYTRLRSSYVGDTIFNVLKDPQRLSYDNPVGPSGHLQ